MIDNISVTEQPKSGPSLVQGPSFRYCSNPRASGTGSLNLSITGTSLPISGTLSIEVDVTSRRISGQIKIARAVVNDPNQDQTNVILAP